MDAPTPVPLSSPSSPILVTPGAILPPEAESNQLADQARHLTLSTSTGGSSRLLHVVSSATACRGPVPGASRRRRRACSACCGVSDAATLMQHAKQSALPIGPLLSTTTFPLSAAAQVSLLTSDEHTREETRMENASLEGCEENACCQTQRPDIIDVRETALLPACSCEHPWTGRGDARLTLADCPNEVLLHILSYLDVCDLLAISRVSAVALLLLCDFFLPPSFLAQTLHVSLTQNTLSTAILWRHSAISDTAPATPAWLQRHLTRA